jgi:hypothetical protein
MSCRSGKAIWDASPGIEGLRDKLLRWKLDALIHVQASLSSEGEEDALTPGSTHDALATLECLDQLDHIKFRGLGRLCVWESQNDQSCPAVPFGTGCRLGLRHWPPHMAMAPMWHCLSACGLACN